MRTLDATRAHPAAAIGVAEAPLTADTDRYMRAAAHALAHAARAELRRAHRGGLAGSRVAVLAGGGHNGGDGLLAGALLARSGCRVTAYLATDHPHAAALREAEGSGVAVVRSAAGTALATAMGSDRARTVPGRPHLVIDALTGIGATGALRPAAAAVIAPLVGAGAPGRRPFRVLAVDLPSGTGVDDGTLPGPVLVADRTVTFTCLKAAHLLPPAARTCGRTEVVDLGLPVPDAPVLAARPDDAELARLLRRPDGADHKYTRGVLGVWAGSRTYPGAAVLTASAAVRVGAGMVRLAAPQRVVDLVLACRPEVVPAPGRCQALVIGPGTDPDDAERAAELDAVLGRMLASPQIPAVLDAGALGLLAARLGSGRRCTQRQVLVPHAGEAATLLGLLGRPTSRDDVEAAPARTARLLAELTGATVVLKGAPTLVAAPNGDPVLSVEAGPAWLATAGSGDVLAGILGGLLAGARAGQEAGGEDLPTASWAALAVRLHARAGYWAAGSRGVGAPAPGGPGGRNAGGAEDAEEVGHPIAALDLVEALPASWTQMASLLDAAGA